MVKRNKKIFVRVTEDTKDDIEDHVDDPDTPWESKSDLLRGAVHKEINDAHIHKALDEALENHDVGLAHEQVADAMEIALSDTTEKISLLEDQVADLDHQLRTNEAVTQLARTIQEDWLIELPEGQLLTDIPVNPASIDGMAMEDIARISGSADALAEVLDREEQMVRRALKRAEEIYPRVESMGDPEEGQTRFWKSNPEKEPPEVSDPSPEEVDEFIEEHGGFTPASEDGE